MSDVYECFRSVGRAIALTAVLLLATVAAAQGCIAEQEPNDTPAEANPVQGAACLAGNLVAGDQDAFVWTVTEEDSLRFWQFELESIRGQLTNLDVYRVEFTDDGSGVTKADKLHTTATLDGRTVTSQPRLFAAGDYVLGLSASGGEGEYSVALLPGEVLATLVTPEAGEPVALTEGFAVAGQLGGMHAFEWSVTEEMSAQLWRLGLTAAVGEELELRLTGPDGEPVLERTVGESGVVSVPGLGLTAGLHQLEVSTQSALLAPYQLTAVTQGVVAEGHEVEPNDSMDQANVLTLETELRGSIASGGDYDYFRFTVSAELADRLIDLQTAADGYAELCLISAAAANIKCTAGEAPSLPGLHLPEGDYGVWLGSRDNDADIPYALLLRAAGEPDPEFATEPNDSFDWATTLPDSLTIRGELLGDEVDYLVLEVTGESQLWRVHVLGSGVRDLNHYAGDRRAGASVRGQDRLRLDNLLLRPGTHYFAVSGAGGDYALRLLRLGPVDGEMPGQPAEGTASEPLEELAPRPSGLVESEPNDKSSNSEFLRFGQPIHAQLADTADRDQFRFHLRNGEHVRLEVTPPEGAEYRAELYWGDGHVTRAENVAGESLTGSEWLPPGDYHLILQARVPTDEYYRVELQRLNPFTVPPGREAGYPEWFGQEEPAEAAPDSLDVDLSLQGAGSGTVAAYWPYGQATSAELMVRNTTDRALDLKLDWHSSDADWQLQLPETLSVAAGGTERLEVPIVIAPDTYDGEAILTVRVRDEADNQQTATATFNADGMAAPVGTHRAWPVPPELLGGLNAAWLNLGAELALQSEDEETVAARHGLPYLLDGLAPVGHDYFTHRMQDRVPSALGMTELMPTVRLAGDAPVEVSGFLLNPTATTVLAESLREFRIYLSLDGTEFELVLEGELSPLQAEQAFVLAEPVQARYARIQFLNNHVPGSDPARSIIQLGEFKVVVSRDSAAVIAGKAGLNIADPDLGGHLVHSDPASVAHSNRILRLDDYNVTARLDFEQEDASWVVAFHNNRAAQITGFRWQDHQRAIDTDFADAFGLVEVSVSTTGPAGPWTQVATWELERSSAGVEPFNLEEPVWARYVRFRAPNLTPRATYDYPELLSVIERLPDAEYASILGEWGHYTQPAVFEALTNPEPLIGTETIRNTERDSAVLIAPGEVQLGTVQLGVNEAWYRIKVPADRNHLSVTVGGEPHLGFDFELLDQDGESVQATRELQANRGVISATVEPGDYWLRIHEPPRIIVIAWDTSGSVANALPLIFQALQRFALSITPGVEEVNLLPFDGPFLLRSFTGDQLRVLEALNDAFKDTSSSSGEYTLRLAAEALATRPGKKAVIFLTDGAITLDGGLWPALLEVQPQVFSAGITSVGSLGPNVTAEQDLLQDYAAVNNGHYEYVLDQGQFDVTFRRAAAWLRRPSHFSASVELEQRWARASAWAEPELQRAQELELIPVSLAGADLTGPVTRAEFAAVAVKVYEALSGTRAFPAASNPFSDTDDPEVLKAFNTGLAVGVSATEFAPDAFLNREQAATILTRVFKKVNLPGWTWATDADFQLDYDTGEPFADDEQISGWARESVYFMAANGIITGTGNGQFTPRAVTPEQLAAGYANATREQALLLAVRLVEGQQ